jgi:hypothetical protein
LCECLFPFPDDPPPLKPLQGHQNVGDETVDEKRAEDYGRQDQPVLAVGEVVRQTHQFEFKFAEGSGLTLGVVDKVGDEDPEEMVDAEEVGARIDQQSEE